MTVKIRTGLREGDEAGRRLAPRLVAAGAAAVCIHPRTAAQLYRGRADHAVTAALAAELPVPVIASGDVDGRAAALALLDGGAAAVMLARHALGRAVALPRGPRRRRGARRPDERLKEVRRFADEVLREMGQRGVAPPAPVLASASAAPGRSTGRWRRRSWRPTDANELRCLAGWVTGTTIAQVGVMSYTCLPLRRAVSSGAALPRS